jgi:hypothetical protein
MTVLSCANSWLNNSFRSLPSYRRKPVSSRGGFQTRPLRHTTVDSPSAKRHDLAICRARVRASSLDRYGQTAQSMIQSWQYKICGSDAALAGIWDSFQSNGPIIDLSLRIVIHRNRLQRKSQFDAPSSDRLGSGPFCARNKKQEQGVSHDICYSPKCNCCLLVQIANITLDPVLV